MAAVGADVVDAGHILAGEDPDDAGMRGDRRKVDAEDFGMRPVGEAEGAMQQTCGFRNIVDIIGGSGDMLMR
ncbi:hypothetical protein ACVIRO_000373 [Rhizobium ruizarguesonis]